MTTRVVYEAVLEYDDEDIVPENARENMIDLIQREPTFGTITVEEVTDA